MSGVPGGWSGRWRGQGAPTAYDCQQPYCEGVWVCVCVRVCVSACVCVCVSV